jgi:hypothetical protein
MVRSRDRAKGSAVLCDGDDERFCVVPQKPGDVGECLYEELRHFLALQIA